MKHNARKTTRRTPKRSVPINQSMPLKLYKDLRDLRTVSRVLRLSGVINSTAGGDISILAFNSATVNTTPDWANFSQEFQEYRVRNMRTVFSPCYPDAYQSGVASTNPCGMVALSRFWVHVPTTASNVLQEAVIKFSSTGRSFSFDNNYSSFPNAQLWTDTTSGVTADKYYGYSIIRVPNTPLIGASTAYFGYVQEFDVEFRAPR